MMAVQRYVFRYRPSRTFESEMARMAAGWWADRFTAAERAKMAHEAVQHDQAVYGHCPFEKEGGGVTQCLQEAKLIGWRSKRFQDRSDGELVPARIVIG